MEEKKRQDLPPGLWVVATPIGNMGELSARARGALTQADAICCEDTRRTGVLLAAAGILGKSLMRLDAHASDRDLAAALERLGGGESLALVTDAGTPAISDPGAVLVSAARRRGVRITPIAGPAAVTALLSISGFENSTFTFRGFFPRKDVDRRAELNCAQRCERLGMSSVWVWYESPERIEAALELIARELSERGARAVVAKELTKLHERVFAGSCAEVSASVRDEIAREGARGEWCFAVAFENEAGAGDPASSPGEEVSSATLAWSNALVCLLNAGVSASEAAKQVSQVFGVAKKPVYECVLKLSGKKK